MITVSQECTEGTMSSDYANLVFCGPKLSLSIPLEEGPVQESSAHIKDSSSIMAFGSHLFKTKVGVIVDCEY